MADKEYIDREALLQRLECSPLFSNIRAGGFFIKNGVLDLVKRQPTADVAEVRHRHKVVRLRGRGIAYQIKCATCGGNVPSNEPYCEYVEYCSECGKKLDDVWQNYCPNCGAKMDGKGEGE